MQFKLRDIFVIMFAIAIPLGILLPLVQRAREAARRMQCSNNLKQLILAVHNYEGTYRVMPTAMGGTQGSPLDSNAGCLAGFVPLTPYLESNPWYNQLLVSVPAGGPAPWISNNKFQLWDYQFLMFLCPSDNYVQNHGPTSTYGRTNYAFCWGDGIASILDEPPDPDTRGPFQARLYKSFDDVIDGLSNTVSHGEIAFAMNRIEKGRVAVISGIDKKPTDCWTGHSQAINYSDSVEGRGGRWCDGRPYYTGFTTVLPPNSLSCTPKDKDDSWGIYSSSSMHSGLVLVAMLDGSVRSISNQIDCGLPSSNPPDQAQRSQETLASPFGIWGAMGTISSGEVAPNDKR